MLQARGGLFGESDIFLIKGKGSKKMKETKAFTLEMKKDPKGKKPVPKNQEHVNLENEKKASMQSKNSESLKFKQGKPERTFDSKQFPTSESDPKDKSLIQCQFCHKFYSNARNRQRHEAAFCPNNPSRLTYKEINNENGGKSGKPIIIQCFQCKPPKEFPNASSLASHVRNYHPEDPFALKCPTCNKEFSCIFNRRRHQRTACKPEKNKGSDPQESDRDEEANESDSELEPTTSQSSHFSASSQPPVAESSIKSQCSYCFKQFSRVTFCVRHQVVCPENPNGLTLDQDNIMSDIEDPRARYECELCDPPCVFPSTHDLNCHLRNYHPKDLSALKCPDCHKKFSCVFNRKKHQQSGVCPKNEASKAQCANDPESSSDSFENSDSFHSIADDNFDEEDSEMMGEQSDRSDFETGEPISSDAEMLDANQDQHDNNNENTDQDEGEAKIVILKKGKELSSDDDVY